MDALKRKEVISRTTLLASLFSFVLLLASLFPGLIQSEEATFSLKGVAWLFLNQPAYWFMTFFAIVFPFVIHRLIKWYTMRLLEVNLDQDHQHLRMREIRSFARELSNDNLDAEFNLEGEEDILGKSLIELRDTLRTNRDNSQKFRAAEEQRKWTVDGLARISEILRRNMHDSDQLSFEVIKELTRYVGALQGGLYLLDNTDKFHRFFELKAFFAYDRRKFAEKRIDWGDGLVGTCALEQKVIYLRNIPESYITVTSGLGETNPEYLILVPLIFEKEVYGVLELASLQPFESDHTGLLEKSAETVASTLSAVRTNITTARLLEESKAQTQILTSHEEEMRQNMEELQATQEEASRQTHRFQELEAAIDKCVIRAEMSQDGRIIAANDLFANMFELAGETVFGRRLEEFIHENHRKLFREAWKSLEKENKTFSGYLKHTTRLGFELWTMSSLTRLSGEEDAENRIVWIAQDTTPEMIKNQRSQVIKDLTEKWDILFDLDVNGNFTEYNPSFQKLLNFNDIELKSLVIFDIVAPIELEAFNRKWEGLLAGTSCNGQFRFKSGKETEIWITGSFGVVYNRTREVSRIVFSGRNVSHEKQLETETREQAENLKRQEKLLHDAEKEMTTRLKEAKAELSLQLKSVEKLKGLHEAVNDESPAGVVVTGSDNRIIFFNRTAEKIWNRDRSGVLNQDISVLFSDQMIEENEIIGSYTRPGDFKITGKIVQAEIADSSGRKTLVMLMLGRNRIDNENTFAAYLLPI